MAFKHVKSGKAEKDEKADNRIDHWGNFFLMPRAGKED
jgi:hypothetical protein